MPDAKDLSPEDKKILEEAHKNRDNPEHPAHKDHPKHGEFLKSIPSRLGGAAIFGAGATAGSDLSLQSGLKRRCQPIASLAPDVNVPLIAYSRSPHPCETLISRSHFGASILWPNEYCFDGKGRC
nr:hypothetical protein CFP56_52525 [Quercus suber]